ncbi:TPA: phage minor tail protein L, partial [Shigella sonnei]|nr:phage minor tail protein L [Shigella sonnei]
MGIKADIQSLSPSALIELFVLDMSNTTSGGKLFFHAGTNELMQPVVWQGVTY